MSRRLAVALMIVAPSLLVLGLPAAVGLPSPPCTPPVTPAGPTASGWQRVVEEGPRHILEVFREGNGALGLQVAEHWCDDGQRIPPDVLVGRCLLERIDGGCPELFDGTPVGVILWP